MDYLEEYQRLIKLLRVEQEIPDNAGAEDVILDQLDTVWYKLSGEEKEALNAKARERMLDNNSVIG